LNDRRHFDDVASDGKLFRVLAAATGNGQTTSHTPRGLFTLQTNRKSKWAETAPVTVVVLCKKAKGIF